MRFRTVFFYQEGGAPTSTEEDATSSVSHEVQGGQEVGVGTRIPLTLTSALRGFPIRPSWLAGHRLPFSTGPKRC